MPLLKRKEKIVIVIIAFFGFMGIITTSYAIALIVIYS